MTDNPVEAANGEKTLSRPEQIFRSNVFWRTFLTVFLTCAVTVTVSLTISASRYENEVVHQIQHSHNLMAERMAKEMGLFFENAITQVKMTGDIADGLHLDPHTMTVALNRLVINAPFFTEITAFTSDERVFATTSPYSQIDRSIRSAPIQDASNGKIHVSRLYFSDNGIPMVSLAVPMRGAEDFRGAIVGELSMKKLWWWIDEINKIADVTLYIVNPDDGLIVADQLKSSIKRVYPGWTGKAVPAGLSMENGEKIFTSVHRTPVVDLILVLKTRMAPFVSHLYAMRYQILALGLGILLVASGLGTYMAWRSAGPLLDMVDAMNKYAQNPGKSRMTTDLPAEFQRMAYAFNKMLDGVEAHQVTLIQQESIVKVGQLASILAHEVRHGLHVMLNIIFMIDSVSNETKNSVNRLVHDLVGKISDIMEFSRAGNISPEPVSADYIALQAAETVRYSKLALGRKVVVMNHKGVPSPDLFADRTKTVAALANMARNSLEAGAQNVYISWEMVRDHVIDFRVRDDGPGVHPDNLEQMFEPFHSSKRKGFGIGLSMAEIVARAHGGTAYLYDTGPSGADVRMILPTNGVPIKRDNLPPRLPAHIRELYKDKFTKTTPW